MPYLIQMYFGKSAALCVSLALVFVGVGFAIWGHMAPVQPAPKDPFKVPSMVPVFLWIGLNLIIMLLIGSPHAQRFFKAWYY